MTWGVPLSVSYHVGFSYCSWGSQGKNTEVVGHSLLQWTTFCQTSPPWPEHLGWPHMAWLSFIELDKAVVLWSDWLVSVIMVLVCLPSDALSQHLPSCLGFSYLGCGVSLHGCSSKVQPLPLTLNMGQLLSATLLRGLSQPACFCAVLFIIGDWNAKVGSQETPGITGKFGLGIRNEVGQRLIEFAKRTHRS